MCNITVILPSLNVSEYIDECIRSVLQQTAVDIEILCIDAGSTDGTLEIINEYATKDARIRVINSEIKSYGYQVNLGVKEAKGKYIGIVETDDFVEPNMFECMYAEAIRYNPDYIKCRGYFATELLNNEFINYDLDNLPLSMEYGEVINPSAFPELEYSDRFIWTGLYKKAFIQNIKLNESKGAAFQDVGFAFQIHSKAQSAIYVKNRGYHYRIGNNSASCRSFDSFKFFIDEYYFAKMDVEDITVSWKKQIYFRMFDQFMTRFKAMAESGKYWYDNENDIEAYRKILLQASESGYLDDSILDADRQAKLRILRESSMALFGFFLYCHEVDKIRYFSYEKKFFNRDVVFFGTGKKSLYPHTLFLKHKVGRLMAYCDNNIPKDNGKLRTLPILSPSAAYVKYPDAMFLITSVKYGDEMRRQLLELGVLEENIDIFDMEENLSIL